MSHATSNEFAGAMDTHKVDFSAFASDISPEEWSKLVTVRPPVFAPIESLSPAHPVGRGRTNLTLIQASVVQTDAVSSSTNFDYSMNPARPPGVSVHFEADAYGITTTANYVFTFYLWGQDAVVLSATQFGASSAGGLGDHAVDGWQTVTVAMNGLPPSQQCYVALEQLSGGAWSWYRTTIGPPPLVFEP